MSAKNQKLKNTLSQRTEKQDEENKVNNENPMERSVTDYEDYEPGFNVLPGGTMLNPMMINPQGM